MINNFQDSPLVSIIIPVYNAESYLVHAIDSAINQTWKNKEIIIVDDGSEDDSKIIAKSYLNDWIKLFSQEKKGASAARNYGISVAKGKFIQFLDADDILSIDKIERQVNVLKDKELSLAVCKTVYFPDGGLHTDFSSDPYEEQFLSYSKEPVKFFTKLWGGYDFNASMIQPNAWLTPKALIETYGYWNESLTVDDDGEFFARIGLNAESIEATSGLNFYRKHLNLSSNLSSRNERVDVESRLNAVLLKKKYLLEKSTSNTSEKAIFKLLTEIKVVAFLNHPPLYRRILNELEKLPKYKINVQIGGRLSQFLVCIVGWKFVAHLQRISSKINDLY